MWMATGKYGSPNGNAMDRRMVAELADRTVVRRLASSVAAGKTLAEARAVERAATAHSDTVRGRGQGEPAGLESLYRKSVATPPTTTETLTLAMRRAEHSFLRRHLLGGRGEAPCCFCGMDLPASLLVAAHIRRRADLTQEEKLQFDRVAVLACTLGCDALFEGGYIAVADNGVVVATEVEVPDGLRARLDALEGRSCSGHTPERAADLTEHRTSRLLRASRP
jgi:hypothetical protein